MKKGIVYGVDDPLFDECDKRVIIDRDQCPPDPLHDYDQVFLVHSNIPREMCCNERDKGYEDPFEEIVDDDGYATGEYRPREGVVMFPVSAYIHSGIALSLGSIREFPFDPGGWDTTPDALYMWTDRERYEKMCGAWMKVPDEKSDDNRTRDATEEEFREYLYKIAESELKVYQDYIDGNCFWYETQVRRPYVKTYDNGEEVRGNDWEDNYDCCGGYYVDKVGDIDFPREEGWVVFDKSGHFVGDEYDIPEYVVTSEHCLGHEGERMFLKDYEKTEDGKVRSSIWTPYVDDALTVRSWYGVQSLAQDVIDKELYDRIKCCVEKDSVRS